MSVIRRTSDFLGRLLEYPKLPALAHLATALTALFAVLALAFAAYQLESSAQQGREQALLQREMAANASWERYMELASARPEFAQGRDYPALSATDKVSYLWFVERMLFAGEQILEFDPNDAQWKLTVQVEARNHASYIGSPDFLDESICAFTQNLRRTLIEGFMSTDRALAGRLRTRHNQCVAAGYSD